MDESSLLLRQIPHSVEAEQSVLGAMLIDPRCIPNVVEQLTGEDFYLKPNRDIYETIYTMFSFSATIDPVTVLDQMKLRGVYDENTTSNYLLQLMEITPTAANVSEYIRIVKDKALLRRISETAGELTTLVQEGGETAQAVLDLAEQRIYAIRQGSPPRAWSLFPRSWWMCLTGCKSCPCPAPTYPAWQPALPTWTGPSRAFTAPSSSYWPPGPAWAKRPLS